MLQTVIDIAFFVNVFPYFKLNESNIFLTVLLEFKRYVSNIRLGIIKEIKDAL